MNSYIAKRLDAYTVGVACGVEFFGEGTEVPCVHDETTDLDGLNVFHLRHFFVLADGGIVHSHFTGMLRLVKLDNTGCLLDCDSGHFEFILQVDRSTKLYNSIYNFVFLDNLRNIGKRQYYLVI